MDIWLEELATSLGATPLDQEEVGDLLDVARDVAHRVERKATPLATFLLGMHVQGRIAAGASPEDAMRDGLTALRAALPPEGAL